MSNNNKENKKETFKFFKTKKQDDKELDLSQFTFYTKKKSYSYTKNLHTRIDFKLINPILKTNKPNRTNPINVTDFITDNDYSSEILTSFTVIKEKENWEFNIYNQLKQYIKKLNLSPDYFELSKKIYIDILIYLEDEGSSNPFEIFLSKFRVNQPKYFALSFLYCSLRKNSKEVSQKSFMNKLNLNVSILREILPILYKILKSIPEYEFIYEIIRPQLLSEDEYRKIIRKYLDLYFEYLNSLNRCFNNIFNKKDNEQAYNLLISGINSVISENKFTTFYNSLKIKTPKIMAATLCLIHINYHKDLKLNQKEFVKFLSESKNLRVNYSKLSVLYSQMIMKYFTLNHKEYKQKVDKYLKNYVKKFKFWVKENLKEKNVIESILDVISEYFINNSMNLYDSIINSGFEIIYIAESNEIHYYFPQIFALSLLFYQVRAKKKTQYLASAENFERIFGEERNYRYITEKSNRLYPFLRDLIGRYEGQNYSKDDFINIMYKELTDYFHIETLFLLKLYKKTDLEPQEFAHEIGYRGGRLFDLIEVVKNKINFIAPQTYAKFKTFIKNHLKPLAQGQFLILLDKLRHIRQKQFIHQNINYDFHLNEENVNKIDNPNLKNLLLQFFNKILNGEIPVAFFNLKSNPRASDFYLKGENNNQLKTELIEKYLFQELKEQNQISIYNKDFYLCQKVREIFNLYKGSGGTPHHNPILKHIILNEDNALAMEIPAWKVMEKMNEVYTGHIDLLLLNNNCIIIADYKPDKTEMLKSLPQICVYGLMLEYILNKIDDTVKLNIDCMVFNKNRAWKFKPEILNSYILDFVKYMKHERNLPLLCKNRSDLEKEIEKIIN